MKPIAATIHSIERLARRSDRSNACQLRVKNRQQKKQSNARKILLRSDPNGYFSAFPNIVVKILQLTISCQCSESMGKRRIPVFANNGSVWEFFFTKYVMRIRLPPEDKIGRNSRHSQRQFSKSFCTGSMAPRWRFVSRIFPNLLSSPPLFWRHGHRLWNCEYMKAGHLYCEINNSLELKDR